MWISLWVACLYGQKGNDIKYLLELCIYILYTYKSKVFFFPHKYHTWADIFMHALIERKEAIIILSSVKSRFYGIKRFPVWRLSTHITCRHVTCNFKKLLILNQEFRILLNSVKHWLMQYWVIYVQSSLYSKDCGERRGNTCNWHRRNHEYIFSTFMCSCVVVVLFHVCINQQPSSTYWEVSMKESLL